jgi:hypothetical protein
MMFHPGILALLLGSGLTAGMLCYSAYEGVRIIREWDIRSGSEQQLEMERRTYLVSTVMSYAMGFQLLSLFLFIYTADSLSPLFVGAMCAAGSLKVNGFGYPTLIMKIVGCLLAGVWLIINAADNQALDYPLIRIKYWLLLFITPFIIVETTLQAIYLLSLKPNIITSCCAVLFNADSGTIMSDLLALPHALSLAIFFTSAPIAIGLGLYVYLKEKGAIPFAIATFCHFVISIVALISFISIYIYELPTHHCPFCLLHQEYGYVGYVMYAAILIGAVTGMGTGAINPFRSITTLRHIIPPMQRKLALVSIVATSVFVLITVVAIFISNLSMAA